MALEIPYRNISPFSWWIASYIERAAWDDEPEPALLSRCLAWENTFIFQSPDREAAYQKAMKLASQQTGTSFEDKGRVGHWVFEGLTSLLPIHEELSDGAEVLWVEHKNRSIKKVRSWIKKKDELEAFDDRPAI